MSEPLNWSMDEELEAELDNAKGELKRELKEELSSGDTHIDASLGMFSLTVDSEQPLEETAEVFSELWCDRIQELEDSRADTVREKLEDENTGIFIG